MREEQFKKYGQKHLSVTDKPAYRIDGYLYVAQIRITGKWLEAIGFTPGKGLIIQYEPNQIIIRLEHSAGEKEEYVES